MNSLNFHFENVKSHQIRLILKNRDEVKKKVNFKTVTKF